jgi:murein DD-endopeptidase MepM/ murein hydrolase activator NlpD
MKHKRLMERIGDFMAGKGFYIVLFLCVAAIGISGYYLLSGVGFGGDDTAAAGNSNIRVIVTPSPTPTAKIPEVKATPAPTAKPTATPAPTAAPAPKATVAPNLKKTVYTWPVKGTVLSGFSLEVLAYDSTMGDWRTHSGVDIAAEMGTQVLAVTDGTVSCVGKDDLMGTTVTISHGDGLESVYSNLAGTPTVKQGDQVETGTVIGSVGDTAIAESSLPSHLYFEMRLNGQAVDPENYLP